MVQDWNEARIVELAKGCARATVGGLAKMILSTLLKTQCAAEGAAPPVEVWDGNVKDTVKVKEDMKMLTGQILQMARSHMQDKDEEPDSDSDAGGGTDTEDGDVEADAQGLMETQLASGSLAFPGGVHAYEVSITPTLITLVSIAHFGRQSKLVLPQMSLLRPRAIVHSNRAGQQRPTPIKRGWMGHCKGDNERPFSFMSKKHLRLVKDELQPAWNTFVALHDFDVATLDDCEADQLKRLRGHFMETQEGLTAYARSVTGDTHVLDSKAVRCIGQLEALSLPEFKRWLQAMHARFSSGPSACHKCTVRGGCILATCGCPAAITQVREQLVGSETTGKIAHAAFDGRRVSSVVKVYDNGCGLASTINTAYRQLRDLMGERCGAVCTLSELLAWKSQGKRGQFPWSGDGKQWAGLRRQAWAIFEDDWDRRVLDIMDEPSMLNKHPLVGLCAILVLIDRFHQSNHTSFICGAYAMSLVPELDWVHSQNVEHRWRQKHAHLNVLHSLTPEAHEVVQMLMDFGWNAKSFRRQLAALARRLPDGCDLAYNVFHQVQARCRRCGSANGACVHTGCSCGSHLLPTPQRHEGDTVLTTFQGLVGDLKCRPRSQAGAWTASADDLPKPKMPGNMEASDVVEEPDCESCAEEDPHPASAVGTVDATAEPCRVTAYMCLGSVWERLDCAPSAQGHAVTVRDVFVAAVAVCNGLTLDELVIVWGPGHGARCETSDAGECFLQHADGTVQCGRLLAAVGGGAITQESDSFECVLQRRGPHNPADAGLEFLPLERGLATVAHESWKRLDSPSWFDDELCNAFIAQLNALLHKTHVAAFVVPTFFLPYLLMGHMSPATVARMFIPGCRQEASFWTRYPTLLFPLHFVNHWALLEARYCAASQRITLVGYDSLDHGGPHMDDMRATQAEVSSFLGSLGWTGETVCSTAPDCPPQLNGHDCGPFMLLTACLLATGRPATSSSAWFADMAQARAMIGQSIRFGLEELLAWPRQGQ